jgi:hypothetical protein
VEETEGIFEPFILLTKRNAHYIRIYARLVDVLTVSISACFSIVPAEKASLNNSINNELIIINLATVPAESNSNSIPA